MSIDFDELKKIKEESIEINKATSELEKRNQERLEKKIKKEKEAEHRAKYYPEALKIFEKLEANLMSEALKGSSEYKVDKYFKERDGYDSESGNIHDYGQKPEYWDYLEEILKENKIHYNFRGYSVNGGMYSSNWTDYYISIVVKI